MSKATVLTLVTTLSLGQDDAAETAIFYDEIVREIGFLEVLTGTETIAVSAGTAVYNVAPDTIRSIEFHSQNSGFLTKADGKGLGSLFGADWRNRTGTPIGVSMDYEDDDSFRLVPSPNTDDTLTLIRTERRDDVPTWLELPIVFEILSREFSRESDHQDVELSSASRAISNLLFIMTGVKENA